MLNLIDIFYRFLILGLFSFGGPIAHIAYFKKTFVDRLKWLDDESYTKIVALSQFLPGPSSSQVGFTIGLKRGGIVGAILAFIAFTLPSFIFLYLIWYFGALQNDSAYVNSIIYALKLFAVVIVLDATISMFKSFCKDKITISIFFFASILLIFFSSFFNQIFILVLCAVFGFLFIKSEDKTNEKITLPNFLILFIFLALLFLAFTFQFKNELINLFFNFYKSGSLVFGGGHVVLPILQESLGEKVINDTFLIAYSLAQTVSGPMFTIATYLGADIIKQSPLLGAIIATFGIFLGGFLLILTFYKSYESFSQNDKLSRVIKAINAAVVALLFATLINTIIPSAIYSLFDILVVICGFVLIRYLKVNIFYIIFVFVAIFLIKDFLL
ncbi:chromate efflux transporter [Aliarcobacter skirrowii]|uniref:Chorismate-binding protein n=1 Tax=Aliarcobacter skirrowii CCUG 10374 TaxID=1032239 RepID=A0AAD0SJT5_9BACT|nr:chromate efflux transporter [Aliarcobacter skirrowii]AXX84034.1 chromate transporter [Aliarcobacter skirrowii CCUG 10374]KAB0621778.1 chromate efflux transporter [Aliarcobacter skirrowii CCUG 10374]RXI27031.1 chorismate-binding protein [Aliarcobacter skirrowii CCUG 10374]SUU95472.1 chromate transporter, chromate ion transporter (CHR) family [Aliarcobacter skirrowii]